MTGPALDKKHSPISQGMWIPKTALSGYLKLDSGSPAGLPESSGSSQLKHHKMVEKKWLGYLKWWRDYLIFGSGSPASRPGPSRDRRALGL